jgi:hypothetical protein
VLRPAWRNGEMTRSTGQTSPLHDDCQGGAARHMAELEGRFHPGLDGVERRALFHGWWEGAS